MFKFLRRARMKFLRKGKTNKYLLYAVGEISLIIIGIVLALQLNNWNNRRQENDSRISLLRDLQEDLQMDIAWNQKEDSLINAYIPRADTAFILFYAAQSTEDLIPLPSYLDIRPNDLSINDEAYQEMITTGKFYLIKSKALKETISEYYERAERAQFYIRTIFEKNYEVGYDIQLVPYNRIFFGAPYLDKSLDDSWIGNPQSPTFLAVERMLDFRKNEILFTRKRQHNELLKLGQALLELIEKEIQ
ncbi:MAG: hypothetical protein HRU41_06175 [Saprospiraceae bacterium]|nr:hypothetical protein [Saprospiraceae bacterium]